MLRPAARTVARAASSHSRTRFARTTASQRWASTVPADKRRSWKSSTLRWGLAGAILYYYNTTTVFADDAGNQYGNLPPHALSESEVLPTLDSYSKKPKMSSPQASITPDEPPPTTAEAPPEGAGALEEEAGQQGAFNEETGEINWDCPCLGGMAHGPCGEEFKAAFSCFVFSKEEPKGVDCIDKFKGMQDCFRLHPDVYGAELEDDDEQGQRDVPSAEDATAHQGDVPSDGIAGVPNSGTNDADATSQKTIASIKEGTQAATEHIKDASASVKAKSRAAAEEVKEKAHDAKEQAKSITKDAALKVEEAATAAKEQVKTVVGASQVPD